MNDVGYVLVDYLFSSFFFFQFTEFPPPYLLKINVIVKFLSLFYLLLYLTALNYYFYIQQSLSVYTVKALHTILPIFLKI